MDDTRILRGTVSIVMETSDETFDSYSLEAVVRQAIGNPHRGDRAASVTVESLEEERHVLIPGKILTCNNKSQENTFRVELQQSVDPNEHYWICQACRVIDVALPFPIELMVGGTYSWNVVLVDHKPVSVSLSLGTLDTIVDRSHEEE